MKGGGWEVTSISTPDRLADRLAADRPSDPMTTRPPPTGAMETTTTTTIDGAVDDRVARAEAQRAAQAALDAAKEVELFGQFAQPPSDEDDEETTEVTESFATETEKDDIYAVKRSETNDDDGRGEGESAYDNAYNAAEDEELLAMEAEKRARKDAAKAAKAAAAAAAKAANREQKRNKKKGK